MIDPDPITFTSSSSVSTAENTTDVITLRASGGGPDSGDTQKYTFTIDDNYGDGSLFEISQTNDRYASLTFKEAPDYELLNPIAEDNTYSIRVRVSDEIDNWTTQDLVVDITNENEVQTVGVADTVTISEDALATIISVLDNDTDVDTGDTLSIAAKTNGSNGTVTDNGDGTVSYTPNANFNGTDTFQYRATDGTDQSELTTVTVTVDAVNDDPTGSVTITGDAKTGQTLTAANTLVDADGIGTISYQWAKDGVDVSGATSATLVLSDTDIGSVYTVAASYTDDDGTAETVASSATSAVVDIDKPFMFTSEIIKASAAPDGAYALDPNEDIIKLTLNVDMARTTDATVDSILGGVLDFSLDWSQIEAIQYDDSTSEAYRYTRESISDGSVDLTTFLALTDSDSTADQFDTVTIVSIYLDTTNPQDTTLMLVDNVDTSGPGKVDHASSNDVAVIYLNPVDSVTSLDVTYGGAVNINQGNDADITQLSYTTTVGINNTPTVSSAISDASTNEDTAYNYDASANFSDIDTGDTLTYSAVIDNGDSTTSDLPSWLSINSTTGVLSGTPNNGDVGSLNIKVSATDASSASASDAFVLTIDNTNDAPTLSGDFAGSIVEGDTNNLVNTVVIDDVDIGDVLDIGLNTLIGNYGSVVFDSNFEWTYTLDNNNTDVISLSSGEVLVDTFELTVSDGTATISKDIDITINGKDAVFNIGTPTPQTIDTNNPNIDLTLDSGQFVKDALVDLGYASITGLSSSWNANSKTLDLSFDGATNDSLLLIENMPTISLDDIGDVFKASLQDAGLSNIQGFSFAYDEVQRHMELKFDSATVSGVVLSSFILSAEINPSTKLIEISGSAHNSNAGNITFSNADLSAGELEAFNALLMMLDAIATVDLTDTNAIALFGLESLGYSDIDGLSSSWNSSANTLTINVNSATYDDRGISDAQIISASNLNGDITSYTSQAIVYGKDPSLSQADISDIVLFVLGELGYSSISGFTSNWVTSNDTLTIGMDSAYLSGTGSITNVSMVLDLNTSGDVSSYSGQAYSPYYGQWGYLTKSDLTTLELAAIKQTYLAIDALESINGQSTSDDIAMIALRVLGYEQISGLTTSWDREYLTSTIEVNSAVLDGNVITNAKIIASTNSSGYIDYYSSIGTVTNQYGSYNVSYDKYDLNDAEEYVVQAGNYAMAEINGALQTFYKYNLSDAELYVIEAGHEILTEIDRVNSNHNFTNGSATIVFNDDGSIKSYDASIDHSDVGTIIGTIADLDASEGSIVEGVYTEISTIETMVTNVQSATSMEDIAKVSLEYTGWSDLTNIAVNWDDDTSTATITFDGLFEGEQRTDPTFVISVGSDGEPTAFSYTADSANGAKQIDLADLNQTQLYGNKVVMKAISDLYDLEQAANHTSKLTNNISFDLYKEGADTNQDLIIDNGELRINESYSFDTIKIADTNNYTQSINISDAIDVLRHIVDLDSFTPGSAGYHAADVNNDGDINISDAIDILRHIVDLEAIDSFDLVDDGGNRVTTLNPTSLSITPNWIMVANGDVNASGEFASDYVMADII